MIAPPPAVNFVKKEPRQVGLKLVTQRKRDLELVEMANQVKLDDVVAAEGDDKEDQDGEDDDLGDENADSFKDSEGPTEQQ